MPRGVLRPKRSGRGRAAAAAVAFVLIGAFAKAAWDRRAAASMPTDVARMIASQCVANSRDAANASVAMFRECEKNIDSLQQLAKAGDIQAAEALARLRSRLRD